MHIINNISDSIFGELWERFKNHGVQVLPFISFFTLYSLED